MTKTFDKHDLYSWFYYDEFDGQGMGYDNNYFRMVLSMLHMNNSRIQSTGDSIWNLPREIWSTLTNGEKRLWMYLREDGHICDTPLGITLISGSDKDQYGRIFVAALNSHANSPQANSRHTNSMPGIITDILLYDLYENVIKEHPQEHQDNDMDTNPDTYIFEEDNYSE